MPLPDVREALIAALVFRVTHPPSRDIAGAAADAFWGGGTAPPATTRRCSWVKVVLWQKKGPAAAGKTSPSLPHVIISKESHFPVNKSACGNQEDLTRLPFTNGFGYFYDWVIFLPI